MVSHRTVAALLAVVMLVAGCGSAAGTRTAPTPLLSYKGATTAAGTAQPSPPTVPTPSVDGVRDAALRWVSATGRLLAMGPIERNLTFERLVAPSSIDAMTANVEHDLDRLTERLPIPASELRLIETPITVDGTLTGNDRAEARVWSVVCFGAATLGAPQTVWRTSTLTLTWTAGDWLLESFTTAEGPTPLAGDALPATWDDFAVVATWAPATEGLP